jgi:hypothetical protein
MIVTYEHAYSALSSTWLQMIDGDEEPWGPDRSSPVIPGPPMPEDPRDGFALPRSLHPSMPGLAPRTTKSQSRLPASLPGRGSTRLSQH